MWYGSYRDMPYPWTYLTWCGGGSTAAGAYDWSRIVYWPWLL
jgi:hypothetical protein